MNLYLEKHAIFLNFFAFLIVFIEYSNFEYACSGEYGLEVTF